jgi:hypothetical protein
MMRSTRGSADVIELRELGPGGAVVARVDRSSGVIDPVRRSTRVGPVRLDRRTDVALMSGKHRTEIIVSRGLIGWKRVIAPLLEIRGEVAIGVPASVARALADELRARGVREASAVIDPLRAHADIIEAGNPVVTSPLARYIGVSGGQGGSIFSALADL